MSDFKIVFGGVRGSHCVPGADTVATGGNSTCVEVIAGGNRIIFDAGTGIIPIGKEIRKEYFSKANKGKNKSLVMYLFFTHTHHDHTEGLPFFEPAYFGTTKIYMFGPRTLSQDLEKVLENAMIPPFFPITMEDMGAQKIINNLTEKNIVLIHSKGAKPVTLNKFIDSYTMKKESVKIGVLKNYSHPRDGVHVYSVEYKGKKVVFSTDVEGYAGGDQRLIQFSKGADVLIHDAQYVKESYANPKYPKQGWGHSTIDMAVEVAQKAEAKKLVLYHHDPDDTDKMVNEKEKQAQKRFPNTLAAREDLIITV
ncbi:MAG: MBL fold metallo-hydrolase [Candidatus Ancaeobacter aquaticus]|nr:MBL fold metallo-hydrolase [Candidatus Ancaeobacter aquaticus]